MERPQRLLPMALLAMVFVLTGCYTRNQQLPAQPQPFAPPAPTTQLHDVLVYFPTEPSLTWIFEGDGNEYASFTRKMMYKENGKVQIAQDNGGTRVGMVLQVSPETVSMIYSQEEYYTNNKLFNETSNRGEVILKAPLKAGAAWSSGRERREVISIDEYVQVPAGSYKNVVKIKVSSLVAHAASEQYEYYAPNTGLILRQFFSDSHKIESRLKMLYKE